MSSTHNEAFYGLPGGLDPQKFCFDTVTPATTTQEPGLVSRTVFNHRPGFEVYDFTIDTRSYPLNVFWSPTDDTGELFAAELQSTINRQLFRAGSDTTVTVTRSGTTELCDTDTGTEFTILGECLPEGQQAARITVRRDDGHDLIVNPGFALDTYSPPLPNGQQWTKAKREDVAGAEPKVLCTTGADFGWQNDDSQDFFEAWPRWRDGRDPRSGNGGNFDYYDVTPTPRGTNVIELNSTDNEGIVWQTFTVTDDGTYRIAATFGGRAGTDEIRIRVISGNVTPTPASVGDILSVDFEARNVSGRIGPADPPDQFVERFPWTEYADTFTLPAGTYTFALIGPNNGQGGSGGLLTDMRVYTTEPRTHVAELVECTADVDVPASTERVCAWWQPILSEDGDAQVDAWFNPDTGVTLTNAEFFAQDPPPGCCDPIEDEETEPRVGQVPPDPSVVVELVCATINGERTSVYRQATIAASGFVEREQFIGTDGAEVSVTSWTPGTCGEPCCPTPLAEGCWDDGTTTGRWVSMRDAEGMVTLIDPTTGDPVDPADSIACPGASSADFVTHVETITNTNRTLAVGNLFSWSVRLRSGAATVDVGDGVVTLDANETISATADDRGSLTETVAIVAPAGSVRLTWIERI